MDSGWKDFAESSWAKVTIPCLSGVLIYLDIPYLSAFWAGVIVIVLALSIIGVAALYTVVGDKARREWLQSVYIERLNKPTLSTAKYVGMLGFSICLTLASQWWLLGIWLTAFLCSMYVVKDANNTFSRK